MIDIQSAAAEIRRGKKERRRKNKPQHENIMVCPITQGDHNNNNAEVLKSNSLILFILISSSRMCSRERIIS